MTIFFKLEAELNENFAQLKSSLLKIIDPNLCNAEFFEQISAMQKMTASITRMHDFLIKKRIS